MEGVSDTGATIGAGQSGKRKGGPVPGPVKLPLEGTANDAAERRVRWNVALALWRRDDMGSEEQKRRFRVSARACG